MSKELLHKEIPEECFICGESPVILYTEHDQLCGCPAGRKCAEHSGWWWAADGETVQCPDCGAIGMVSADGESAHVSWDEESDHNVACAEKYEGRKS
jgi:hypothetical protein